MKVEDDIGGCLFLYIVIYFMVSLLCETTSTPTVLKIHQKYITPKWNFHKWHNFADRIILGTVMFIDGPYSYSTYILYILVHFARSRCLTYAYISSHPAIYHSLFFLCQHHTKITLKAGYIFWWAFNSDLKPVSLYSTVHSLRPHHKTPKISPPTNSQSHRIHNKSTLYSFHNDM